MRILQLNSGKHLNLWWLLFLLITVGLAGCQPIQPTDRLPNPAETSSTLSSNPNILTEGDQATLRISRWVSTTTRLDALAGEEWGEAWVAFGRRVLPPYEQVHPSTETTTGGWVLISPDERLQAVTRVHETSTQTNTILATRVISEFIAPPGQDFGGLDQVRMNYWNTVQKASLWIDSIFIDGTWYSLPPELGLTLVNGPYQLKCENSRTDEFICVLRHQYEILPLERYTAYTVADGHEVHDLFFYTHAEIIPPAALPYDYAKCDPEAKICLLGVSLSESRPDWCAWIKDTCKEMGCYDSARGAYECAIRGCYICE